MPVQPSPQSREQEKETLERQVEQLEKQLQEIKKKEFLEGATSIIYDISQIPEQIKDKNKKITVSSVTDWAEKKLDEINRELNQMSAFELTVMLTPFPKQETEAKTE